jgi:putative salt-induced outer membrane protein YdiY
MFKKIIPLFLAICFATNLQAECKPCVEDPNPTAWKKSLAFGFNMTDGNSETSLLNIRLKANQEKDKNIWIFDVEQGWGESVNVTTGNEDKTVDFTKSLAQYKRLLSEKIYVGTGINASQDDIADVSYRVIPSIFVGYFIVKTDNTGLALDLGPAYTIEKVGGIENDYFSPRIGDRFTYKISETSSIFQTADVVFDVDDSDNYLITAEVGIQAALNSYLSLVLSVKDNYDNVPAEDRERNDVIVVSALSVTL